MRLGFTVSQFLGRVLLTAFFICILTPMGWILRLAGKDPLQLRRPRKCGNLLVIRPKKAARWTGYFRFQICGSVPPMTLSYPNF